MEIKEFECNDNLRFRENDERTAKLRSELNKLYHELIDFLKNWVDMPEDNYKLIAIWIIGTYFHKKFNTYPFLYFNAMRGSGKTRTLNLISWLQNNGNGNVLNNPSESVIFRTAQERGLVFDEMESIRSKEKNIMREILNSAYKRGGKVLRMKKVKRMNEQNKLEETQEVEEFDIFTPIAMANIQGVDEVLSDRCITTILEKSSNHTFTLKIEDFADNAVLSRIKANLGKVSVGLCNVWLVENGIREWNKYVQDYTSIHNIHTIHNYTQPYITNYLTDGNSKSIIDKEQFFNKIIKTGLYGRNLELFFPLLILSDLIGDDVFEDFLRIATELNKGKREEEYSESKDVSVIDFISQCDRHRYEYVFMNMLYLEFKEFVGASSQDLDKWLTPEWLGLALKRLKLVQHKKRTAKGILALLNIDFAKEKIKMFKHEEIVKK